jgi:hypothetical protein
MFKSSLCSKMGAGIECRRIQLPSKISKSQTLLKLSLTLPTFPYLFTEDNLDLTLN